jgi:hypothetical protein
MGMAMVQQNDGRRNLCDIAEVMVQSQVETGSLQAQAQKILMEILTAGQSVKHDGQRNISSFW